MSTYRATILDTGATYDYQADTPVGWDGMNPPEQHVQMPATAEATGPIGVTPPKITKLAFDNRFTIPELTAIEMASLDYPTASEQQRVLAASLRIMMRKQEMATCIDLSLPDAGYFLQILVGVGLLAPHRPAQILSHVAVEGEIYHG